ncbi:hemolysin XhlA [Anoxybacillus thermarum]|uniref:Hemolysin XhlA n=1 Tax=Anoxybacillus thermarum TaxID=404937 RepID=A0A0D0QAW1_9BACL|nr:hemolysin XhlA [Anoxybacillus thermarum]
MGVSEPVAGDGFNPDFFAQRIAKLETDVDMLRSDMVDVKTRLAVAESNIKDMREDISAIKSNTTWILRLIIGGIVGALLTFIIQGGVQ